MATYMGTTLPSQVKVAMKICLFLYKDIENVLAVAPYFGSYIASRDTNMATYMGTTLPSQVKVAMKICLFLYKDIENVLAVTP
jgi:hypothetical protein